MRKALLFILVIFIFSSCEKKTNWRVTLDRNSTEPYGCYLAKEHLQHIFPNAEIKSVWDIMAYLTEDIKSYSDKNETLISVTRRFALNADEAGKLYSFIEEGGRFVLATSEVNDIVDSVFKTSFDTEFVMYGMEKDSTSHYEVVHENRTTSADFEGVYMPSYLNVDEIGAQTIGHFKEGKKKRVNVNVHPIGKGELMLISSPLVFTNHFLLQKENKEYYESLLSNLDKYPNKVVWNSKEFHAPKREKVSNPGSFWGLLNKKEYRAAFLTLLAMGLLYLLFNIKRRQRPVPIKEVIANDSLSFVSTVGQLYFNEKDHPNLARKMIKHYLDYIRTQYKMTARLDQDFAHKLSKKLNKDKTKSIAFIKYLTAVNEIEYMTEADLKFLYEQLKTYS